jgi:hypothetical protein
MEEILIEGGLWLGYILIAVAAIGAIVMPLLNSINDPKSLLKGGVGVLALLVIFGIAYLAADNEVTTVYAKFDVDASLSQFIGGALTTMYVLVGAAFAGVVATEVFKIFR